MKGNYARNPGGTLQLNVAGPNAGEYDFLNVNGNASLNGLLQLVNRGFTPAAGEVLGMVTTGGRVTHKFARFGNPFSPNPSYNTIDIVYGNNFVEVRFLKLTSLLGLPLVPEPLGLPTARQ